jgi:beta-phosphoglucomutase-like phosphatase (HAD superfamily)
VTLFVVFCISGLALIAIFFLKKKVTSYRAIKKMPTLPPTKLAPQNSIIVFDIHGVLFTHHYTNMLKQIARHGFSFTLLRCALNPRLITHSLRLVAKQSVPEAYIVGLAEKFKCLQPFVPLGITIANTQIPNLAVWHLVHELKKNGYELHILSNIGQTIFEDLRTKYPEIFSAFSAVKVANPQEQYIGKPNPLIFNTYLTTYNPTNKQIIFIDDKPKNIKAAEKNGMMGVYFCCPSHVRSKFEYLGIL